MVQVLVDLKSHLVKSVLGTLLKDRTTGKNIIFATDLYSGVSFTDCITKKILSDGTIDILPRVLKGRVEQGLRTRIKAEVFTPSWICNKMNNHCDAEWFGRENVFNIEQPHDWIPTENKVEFSEEKSWKDYVDSRRLEITCGEAPYLVSRYDTATGEVIPIHKRIGVLDRKLRVVNENAQTRRAWNHWAYRAFESTYGYEFQGDNLLIARINLLETFCEYTRDRWEEGPTEASLKRIANIISWNLWQMDGLRGITPCTTIANTLEDEALSRAVECRICDWRERKIITYKSLMG